MKKQISYFLMLLTFFSVLGSFAHAQSLSQQLKGRVTDANNDPIIGASIMVTNSKEGTVTDMEG